MTATVFSTEVSPALDNVHRVIHQLFGSADFLSGTDGICPVGKVVMVNGEPA